MSRYLKLLGAGLLSAGLLVGCANNDDVDPAPEDNNINDNVGNDITDTDNNDALDGVENPGDDGNNGSVINNGGNGSNDNTDINVPGDGDTGVDNNTPAEDIIEDGLDMKDRDNKDR